MDNEKLLEVALCGYLPYGVKCQLMGMCKDEYADEPIPLVYTVTGVSNGRVIVNGASSEYDMEDVFPMLNPITCLAEEITVEGYNNGEKFVPLMRLFELYETHSFQDGNPKLIFQPENVISCKHNVYDKFCKKGEEVHEFQIKHLVKTGNMGDLVHSFSYDPAMRRFSNRDETRRLPHGIAYQADMFDLMNQWLIDWRGLIDKGLAVALE